MPNYINEVKPGPQDDNTILTNPLGVVVKMHWLNRAFIRKPPTSFIYQNGDL